MIKSDDVLIIWGITKKGNLVTNRGILNDKFEKADEILENKKPVKVIHFKRPKKFLVNGDRGVCNHK